MRASMLISTLLIGWAICVAMSFLHAGVARPTGYGFNIIIIWVLWQMAAAVLAVIILIARFGAARPPDGWLRWACLVPPILSGGLVLFVVIWLAIAP